MHSPLLLFYGPSVLVLLRILFQQTFVSSPVLYKPTLQWLFTINNRPLFLLSYAIRVLMEDRAKEANQESLVNK